MRKRIKPVQDELKEGRFLDLKLTLHLIAPAFCNDT